MDPRAEQQQRHRAGSLFSLGTIVACLLTISTYCVGLEKLEIHFSTTNIVNDFKNIQEVPHSNNYARPPGAHLRVWISIEYRSPSTRPVLKPWQTE